MNILSQSDTVLYPLTHPQKRIWYIENIYPGTSLYNIGGTVRIKGKVNKELLEKAINIFIKKNEGIRLRILGFIQEPKQYIYPHEEIALDYKDFRKCPQSEEEFNNWVEAEAETPFELQNQALFYFALFSISDSESGYLVKFHHIIADGWSMSIMTEQICEIYEKLIKNAAVDDSVEYSYIEYIEKEKEYLQSDKLIKNKSFWNEKFTLLPEQLPANKPGNIEGERKSFVLSQALSQAINSFVSDNKYSLNTFFTAIYLVYRYIITQENDNIIGSPVLNRSGKKERSMFGMFTSAMPFRFVVNPKDSILEMLDRINSEYKKCYQNQRYPYDLLIQDLELKKKGINGLFNTCINFYSTKMSTELDGAALSNFEFYSGRQLYGLNLVIKEWCDTGCIDLYYDYKKEDYATDEIINMHKYICNLTRQVLEKPLNTVDELELLTAEDKKSIVYGFNKTDADYPRDKTIYRLFEEQAERAPDKIAVSLGDMHITYRELNMRANQLAHHLIKTGLKNQETVGIMTTHSVEAIVGILGTLKAGGIYTAIDPDYPENRIEYMLRDAGINILLTNLTSLKRIDFKGVVIKLKASDIYADSTENPGIQGKPEELAYILYTSGSTGRPKGVMIHNRGLVNYIWWAKKTYIANENDVMPLYSSLSFDLTVTSIFTPLICGCRIIVYENNGEEYVLYRILRENKVTLIKLTPAHLKLIKDMDNTKSSVKRLIVGGENLTGALSNAVHKSFGGNIEIFNEYGPTETVVGCMIHKYSYLKDTGVSVPIGKPADNVQIYLLNDRLEVIPYGQIGEIYISGDGVAKGYNNNPELSAESFIDNPYIPGSKMYETGDLGRFVGQHIIEYTGRADKQVKIQGYRIELEEITNILLKHEEIKDAVVMDRSDEKGERYLCAYIVADRTMDSKEIRYYLAEHLPIYAIPRSVVMLDEIPLTISGKVNYDILSPPKEKAAASTVGFKRAAADAGEFLSILMDTIKELLGLRGIDYRDNFYHLGGDSIKAIRLASELNERGLKLSVNDILTYPVLEQMAERVICEQGQESAEQGLREGKIENTPILSWFFSQDLTKSNHYGQSIMLELNCSIELSELEASFNKLLEGHDALRLNFDAASGCLYYNNKHLDKVNKLEFYDFSGLETYEKDKAVQRVCEAAKTSFDIEKGLLIKGIVFVPEEGKKRMLLTAHHLVVDGVSWQIIMEDFHSILMQIKNGKEIELHNRTHSFQHWARLLTEYSKKDFSLEQAYWEKVLEQSSTFAADFGAEQHIKGERREISFTLSEEDTRLLMHEAKRTYNTEPKELLIAALAMTVKEYMKCCAAALELEGHGREEGLFEGVDLTKTVGWFTTLYPAFVKVPHTELPENIKAIKEQLRQIPKKGFDFGILYYIKKTLENKSSRNCIRFNYLGDYSAYSGYEYFKLLEKGTGSEAAKENELSCLMEMNIFLLANKLNVIFVYFSNRLEEYIIKEFAVGYINNIKKLVAHCMEHNRAEFTPSDFKTVKLTQEELDSIFNS